MLAIDTTPLRRRRRWPGFVALAIVVAAVTGAGQLVAARQLVDAVPRLDGLGAVLRPTGGKVENYLLVGSDSRAGGDPNTGQTGDVTGSRSDTIMILRRDPADGTAALLSIPRDLYVDTPTHTGRVNGAYNDGPSALVKTIGEALGIPLNHYVEIDFVGFKQVVDSLGGVVVCFFFPARDANTGLDIAAPGCQRLDGTMALAYARSRHFEELRDGSWTTDPRSDLGRSARQRDFVNRVLHTAIDEVAADPFRAGEIGAAIGSSLRIDDDLDPFGAASSLRQAMADGLTSYALPVVAAKVGNADVLKLGAGADAVLAYFRGDGPRPPAP